MTKIRLLAAALVVLLLCSAAMAEDAVWQQYRSSFISNDGRIMDHSREDISHSEGQAFGMLFSIAFNDKASFDKMWRWTKSNLGVRTDGLFAWEWGRRPNGEWEAIDYNNASDGDILIAYALIRASEIWPRQSEYRTEGLKIIRSIRKRLHITWQGRVFILPGYSGFTKENGIVINPSYLVLPAFRKFAEVDEQAFWKNAYDGGVSLDTECLSEWCLPADWVLLADNKARIYTESSAYFGYDAIRTLIYLAIEKVNMPGGVVKVLDLYEKTGVLPARIDLANEGVSIRDASAGHYAAYSLAAKSLGRDDLGERLLSSAKNRISYDNNGYYSASLYILAKYGNAIFK